LSKAEAIAVHGIPTKENFDDIRRYMITSIGTAEDFQRDMTDTIAVVDDFLSKQGSFIEFYKESIGSNSHQSALDKFKEKIVILKAALNEYNQTGEVTSDTYNKVIALGKDCEDSTKDCAEMFDFSSGKIKLVKDNLDSYVDSLVGETGKTLAANEATADQIAIMAALADSVKSNEKAAEQAADDMKSLMTVLDGVKDKSRYGTAELYDLIRQYPELESAIIETADGYTFEESAIVSLIEQKAKMVKVNNILLTQQAKEARNALILASNNVATAENIDAIISKYNVDSFDTGKNSYINAWKEHFNQKETPVFIKGVKEYVEAVLAEKEYVKTVEGLLKDVMSGEYYAGDKDSGGNRKTAFEKEYERHQHLLAMNKEPKFMKVRLPLPAPTTLAEPLQSVFSLNCNSSVATPPYTMQPNSPLPSGKAYSIQGLLTPAASAEVVYQSVLGFFGEKVLTPSMSEISCTYSSG
jgi:hypothetical protein